MKNVELSAKIFNIQKCSFNDGPGIRTSVFFKGCNLNCLWCHNPEGKSSESELLYFKKRCTGCGLCKEICKSNGNTCQRCGECARLCPNGARELFGKSYTVEELYSEIVKDEKFYHASGGGVTFTGGECMLQIDFLTEILKRCKAVGIHTAIDTAGHIPWERFDKVLPYTDLFLYDIKSIDSEVHKRYTGVDNGLILKNYERLVSAGKTVYVRIPVIAGVNDSTDAIKRIDDFFKKAGYPEKAELLPYHSMGDEKYVAKGMNPPFFSAPSDEKIAELSAIFKRD